MALLSRARPTVFPSQPSHPAPLWTEPLRQRLDLVFACIHEADLAARDIQPEITRYLKPVMADVRQTIAERFRATSEGVECGAALSAMMDAMLKGLYGLASTMAYPSANQTMADGMAMVALGGYGRGLLAPHSDIDLMFLLPYKRTARAEQIVEFILYVLWDMNLKVGQAVRSVEECLRLAKADMVVRTTLIDMRMLAGDDTLLAELTRRLNREVLAGNDRAFLAAKIAEREQRSEKPGESRYSLEPNIKTGKGGLRDLHFIQWLTAQLWRTHDLHELVDYKVFLPAELRRLRKAEAFLWSVRTHLHYLLGRAEERLTFDVQQEIARRLGYTDRAGRLEVERFMRRYFLIAKEVGELNRIFLSAVEAELGGGERRFLNFPSSIEGFPLRFDQLSIPDETYFERNPFDLLRIFLVSLTSGRTIHPRAAAAISRARMLVNARFRTSPVANALFLIIVDRPNCDLALRQMNETGILGRFLPDWGRVVAQMQYDMYHVYTVDEHTLLTISNLARLERGEAEDEFPLATSCLRSLSSRRELYLALILHDIAKGRGGDHSWLGQQVAFRLCRRLGMSDAEVETVAWLVRWHLSMSDVALKRDLEDEKTIADFAALVQSPERLRLMLVLTTCDIESVGPGRWNSWKAGLLAELFARTSDMLSGTPTARGSNSRVLVAQETARAELADWTDAEFASFATLGAAGYWLAYDPTAHARHARMIGQAEADGEAIAIMAWVDAARAVTEIAVYAADQPLLFSHLAGGIAATGFSIVDAKISPLSNGKVLDVFSVHDANGATGNVADRSERLRDMIAKSMAGSLSLGDTLSKRSTTLIGRTKALPAPPRVIIDNDVSQGSNVIEVNGRDRPGLLYALTTTLDDVGVRISSAKISTHGHRVVDVFYVTDRNGRKITEGAWLHDIYVRLMGVLGGTA